MFYCWAGLCSTARRRECATTKGSQRLIKAPRRPIERSLERSGVLLSYAPLDGLVW